MSDEYQGSGNQPKVNSALTCLAVRSTASHPSKPPCLLPLCIAWPLLKAMASGCLIIGSDTAPVREVVIKDGVSGVLVGFFEKRKGEKRKGERFIFM